jgi:hypothetical protein
LKPVANKVAHATVAEIVARLSADLPQPKRACRARGRYQLSEALSPANSESTR